MIFPSRCVGKMFSFKAIRSCIILPRTISLSIHHHISTIYIYISSFLAQLLCQANILLVSPKPYCIGGTAVRLFANKQKLYLSSAYFVCSVCGCACGVWAKEPRSPQPVPPRRINIENSSDCQRKNNERTNYKALRSGANVSFRWEILVLGKFFFFIPPIMSGSILYVWSDFEENE